MRICVGVSVGEAICRCSVHVFSCVYARESVSVVVPGDSEYMCPSLFVCTCVFVWINECISFIPCRPHEPPISIQFREKQS